MTAAGTPKGSKAGSWTDRELAIPPQLVYLFGLVEFSNVKLDMKNAPRPNGRTVRGCEQKIQNLKSYLKADLEALRAGAPVTTSDATPMAQKGRKRKADDSLEADDTPSKRARGKKAYRHRKTDDNEGEDEDGVGDEDEDEQDCLSAKEKLKFDLKKEAMDYIKQEDLIDLDV